MERSEFDTTVKFDQEFAGGKTKEELVLAINYFLPLHTSKKIQKFHLYFCAFENFLHSIENWVSYIVGKGVEEIILDFSMDIDDEEGNGELKLSELPAALFACRTLKKLCLRRCIFSPPISFVKFDILNSLSIEDVKIKNNELQKLISNCSQLENLRIASCILLDAITVSSKSLLKLTIENPCSEYYDIRITTPNLKSFIYYGMHSFGDSDFNVMDSFINISSLSDAFICAIDSCEPEHDFVKLMYDLKHVEVLTVCKYTLWCVTCWDCMEQLPIYLQSLKELQLLAGTICTTLEGIYGFFRLCPSPFIEKLFIQLWGYDEDQLPGCLKNEVKDPLNVHFNHLKVIVMRNFLGCQCGIRNFLECQCGMRLVSFLLQKAVNLESMVLIMHSKFTEKSMEIEWSNESVSGAASGRMNDWKSVHDEVLMLPKASPHANISLLELGEGSMYWNPTHTEYFGEY